LTAIGFRLSAIGQNQEAFADCRSPIADSRSRTADSRKPTMNRDTLLFAIRCLIVDTFRQARASGIFWLMLAISAVCIAVCLSITVTDAEVLKGDGSGFVPRDTPVDPQQANMSGVVQVRGRLHIGFGAIAVPLGRDAPDEVRFVQLLLAGVVADAGGILLMLVWTAGFLPTFLEPSAASVLLAKPVPRWGLLMGKYIGVLTFVLFQALIFVLGTYLALGLRTGVWDPIYLLCIPLLLIHFAIFFSVSTLLAVSTRSTIACVFGSIIFWLLCWGMNYGRHMVVAMGDKELEGVAGSLHFFLEVGYWILPKPADLGVLLFDALQTQSDITSVLGFEAVKAKGAFSPVLSVAASLAFTVVALVLSAYEFHTMDY
jgi:ABC-type transport system involved in multi-copper enzyme maturation permease subunit